MQTPYRGTEADQEQIRHLREYLYSEKMYAQKELQENDQEEDTLP